MGVVVTIDGPSGAGKSTASRRLAQALGYAFLDTGALYRGVALGASLASLEDASEEQVAAWLPSLELEAVPQGGRFLVLLAGRDVEPFIRNERMAAVASRLSALGAVRAHLLELQRRAGQAGDLVAEGRDMGSVVFPGAQAKFFLTASPEERARRRLLELLPKQPGLTLEAVRADMAARDQKDAQRALSPLAPAPDAQVLDTSGLDLEQVVAALLAGVRARVKAG